MEICCGTGRHIIPTLRDGDGGGAVEEKSVGRDGTVIQCRGAESMAGRGGGCGAERHRIKPRDGTAHSHDFAVAGRNRNKACVCVWGGHIILTSRHGNGGGAGRDKNVGRTGTGSQCRRTGMVVGAEQGKGVRRNGTEA